jgi:hypothetical protein
MQTGHLVLLSKFLTAFKKLVIRAGGVLAGG